MKSTLFHNTRRAVTLTELLVVLAIISLLATLAVPVYVSKTEQARRATARFEVRAIAEAQESVALAHGFYVPIHLLDNVPNPPTGSSIPGSAVRDDWDNEVGGGPANQFVVNAFTDIEAQIGAQPSINEGFNGLNSGVQSLIVNWTGPFLNPTRVTNDPAKSDIANEREDVVLDPWGRPYLFYSPLGIIWDNGSGAPPDLNGFDPTDNPRQYDNGELSRADAYRFDRFAIVSYAANAISDTDSTTDVDDDVFYRFGFTPNETAYSIF